MMDTTSSLDWIRLFRTFKLLPGAQGTYKIDPGRRSVSTTCGILVKKLKEEGERERERERVSAEEADAAATGCICSVRPPVRLFVTLFLS